MRELVLQLSNVSRQQLRDGKVRHGKQEPQVRIAARRGERPHRRLVAQIDQVQAHGRTGGEGVMQLAPVLIPQSQHRELHGNHAPFTIVGYDLWRDILSGHDLADETIIANMNVVDQPEHLIVIPEGSAHKSAERRQLQLIDAAAHHEAAGA